MNYNEIKKKALERYFSRTNEMQRKAVFQTKGAVLIIAGAGSGKTTVLCNRIANLLLFGDAYNSENEPSLSPEEEQFLSDFADGKVEIDPDSTAKLSGIVAVRKAAPWKILAVTFTNKAAAELKERLSKMNAPAEDVWASTFHSCCVKILRRGIESIGYKSNFTIYDSDDTLRVIKSVMKDLQMPEKTFNPKVIQNAISRSKDKLISPEHFSVVADGGSQDFMLANTKHVYEEYQKRLRSANALDFDDIIMKTVELFENCPDILDYWQRHFEYIMVDEYQDTNHAQYKLISLLAGKGGNLCVVGDEDQSIYRFRGATIENILSFEDEFGGTVIKLEQNYRSTETILNAANAVIGNNTQRKAKNLWSDLGEGDKISVNKFPDEQSEALFVADTVIENSHNGRPFSGNAVLYRTNAQSRTFELALSRLGVPYRIIGGTKFYERKEIRDVLAYMSIIANEFDSVRMKRVINEPKRNIGDVTQLEIERVASAIGISMIETMERADEFATLAKKAKPLQAFAAVIHELSNGADERPLDMLVDDIIEQTGYKDMLMHEGEEGEVRLQNIMELKSSIITFCEENEEHSLENFLEQAALISDMDSYESGEDKVVMMTMHSAKGLEFDTVFLVGAEENLFPSYRCTFNPLDIEEERRLAYVAITRAKRMLYITTAEHRLIYGQTQRNRLSRFVKEIPEKYVTVSDTTQLTLLPRKKREKKPGYLQEQAKHETLLKRPESVGTTVFSDGERVNHRVFGDGTVLSATPAGNDTLLEIAFDRVGTKKIMANFAKITKVE